MFSKSCKYAIRATVFICSQSREDSRTSLKDISDAIDSPPAFTAKILQKLANGGVISSVRGPSGGFFMDEKQLHDTTISEVVGTIDGQVVFQGCTLGLPNCDPDHPCPLHDELAEIRDRLRRYLESTTIVDLEREFNRGSTFLKV